MATDRKEYNRKYREAHKEELLAKKRQYREKHRDRLNAECREYYRNNREYLIGQVTKRERRRLYGITDNQYIALLEKQGGHCAICEKSDLTLCVDHCHASQVVRGLLCRMCNIALGSVYDNVDVLLRAANYLQKFNNVIQVAHA